MKKFIFLTGLLFGIAVLAQAPEKMSYQAIVRNASGQLLQNQNVAVKASILQGSSSGTVVYSERLTGTTNGDGLLSMEIGSGAVLSGTFSTIDWSSGNYWLKTETDPTGGTNYSISGASQLLSVPYAMYAKTSGGTHKDVLGVTPMEFKSADNSQISSVFLTYFPTSVTSSLTAPIILPHGATVTQIRVYYLDNDYNKDYTLSFSRLPTGTPFPETLLSTFTSGGDTAMRYTTFNITTPIVIDNENNFYYLTMAGDFSGNDGIGGVKITYSYPTNN